MWKGHFVFLLATYGNFVIKTFRIKKSPVIIVQSSFFAKIKDLCFRPNKKYRANLILASVWAWNMQTTRHDIKWMSANFWICFHCLEKTFRKETFNSCLWIPNHIFNFLVIIYSLFFFFVFWWYWIKFITLFRTIIIMFSLFGILP